MTDVEVRSLTTAEAEAAYEIRAEAFTSDLGDRETWLARHDMADFLGAFVDGSLTAIVEAVPLAQHFGGRAVPAAAVASVAVAPEWRGRGVGGALLVEAIARMRADGLAFSALHPATTTFYRSLGWEIGGRAGATTVPCSALAALPRVDAGRLRRAEPCGSDLREFYARHAPSVNGTLQRSDAWWDRMAPVAAHWYAYVVEIAGAVAGYVVYHQSQAGVRWGYALQVREILADGPDAARALWRHVGAHASQVDTVEVLGPEPTSLTLLLGEQVARLVDSNHWMARIVDAPAAIEARGYPEGVAFEVALTIVDPVAPWNDGDWTLEVAGGRAALASGGDGDVVLTINGLASLFTGWASARTLAATGLLSGASSPQLDALDAAFAGPPPMLLEDF